MTHKRGSGNSSNVGNLPTTPPPLHVSTILSLARASRYLACVLVSLALVATAALLSGASTADQEDGLTIMAESSVICPHFRAHQQTEEPTRQGVKKFVLQESAPAASGSDGCAAEEKRPWRTLSFRQVADLWQRSPLFAEMFATSLAAVPFGAMFWESLPVTKATMDKPYEYVTVDAPRLSKVSADGGPFSEHLASGEGTTKVMSFRNMRKDALLVVPCFAGPPESKNTYAHLASFVRGAPRAQVIDYFSVVGASLEAEVASRTDESPVWLSTSGLGVYWLHARLDSVPKYYTYNPYKTG